ncbi:M20 aminoacylase family protein [Pluralibacter gergoviae]|uniref:M20 aminoacylase family protein n=1 Tax=Pluralibacter gergoviae TaxID=61647 RepID=A0AAW8HY18_PLUGE|nr:M20 aminoacylase family protein [Pluralibacter gergoviae]AVR04248.1 amidohydrolase [Pluralibacter gergoviae]KMK07016.1 amidohydrolase [Pluralibacter gergoviae]KMK09317.1 amidohydrolase [Pluralibacter gergoviae]KMK27734.1 amidohydrolase [Pluralibacter gergoviae]MDQ2312104.1 M20 aminoacylase family protein [Pluralibacter gergoviae]
MSDFAIPEIKAAEDEMIAIRRHLHANPELSLEEFNTSALVADKLAGWGYAVTRGLGKTGVVGTLTKGDSARTIGLRADMDALPIVETTGLPWASRTAGKMHACGHDGHTTILLAAAKYIASDACRFNGTVHLIFQPAEEAFGGADLMVKEGLFTRFPCDRIFGLHNMPGLPAGRLGFYAGNFMASADTVKITITGYGGHGAHPERTIDPIVAGAALVMGLQSIVSRNVPPGETAVVSVGTFHAGIASNVIPESVEMELSVRAMKPEIRDLLIRRIHELADLTVKSYGATSQVEVYDSYPVLTNSEAETDFARELALEVFGRDGVLETISPMNASEDFAFMLRERPGCYFLLGNGEAGKGSCMVHNPGYDFNDDIISIGATLFVRLVEKHCC